jgi:CBS domain-containing protein
VTETSAVDPARVAPDAANPAVAEVMRDEVVFCLPSTPLDAVAKLMADNELTEICVLIDRRPVGYVRSRDVLEKLVDGNLLLSGSDLVRQQHVDVLARDVLRTPPLLVDEHDQLAEVVALLRGRGRDTALVMHDDERPVGMITVREIAAHAARQLAGERAGA